MVYSLRILNFSLISLRLKSYGKYLLYAELLVNKCKCFPHYIAYKSMKIILSTLREWVLLTSVNFVPTARKKRLVLFQITEVALWQVIYSVFGVFFGL